MQNQRKDSSDCVCILTGIKLLQVQECQLQGLIFNTDTALHKSGIFGYVTTATHFDYLSPGMR